MVTCWAHELTKFLPVIMIRHEKGKGKSYSIDIQFLMVVNQCSSFPTLCFDIFN